MNPLKLPDIQPVTLLANITPQYVLLDNGRSYSIAHDGENRVGVTDTTKIYLYTAISGVPAGIVANDNESQSSLAGDFTSGINTNKVKLMSGRSISIGPGIGILAYILSGNGTTGPTFLVAPDKKEYGLF